MNIVYYVVIFDDGECKTLYQSTDAREALQVRDEMAEDMAEEEGALWVEVEYEGERVLQ